MGARIIEGLTMLEIKLDADQLDHGLNTLLKNATNTRAIMRGIATELLSMTEENFESEGWGGQRWKQSRRAADEGGKTLQKSGQLAASPAIHHLGGQAGRGHKTNLPARPYLPINGNNQLQPDTERRILDIAIAALKKGL